MGIVWIAEAVGLAVGGPLTHYVRALQQTTAWRCVLYALWSWLTWHWFLEWRIAPSLIGRRFDDGIAVGLAMIIGWVWGFRPKE